MLDQAVERWAGDLWAQAEGDFSAPTWEHIRGLWNDLRPAARESLRFLVEAALENLEDGPADEIMPPCEARFVRFVADLVDDDLGDRVQEQMRFTTDAAWYCDCDECLAFVSRVEAGTRRFAGLISA
jgi:hypothetical protein